MTFIHNCCPTMSIFFFSFSSFIVSLSYSAFLKVLNRVQKKRLRSLTHALWLSCFSRRRRRQTKNALAVPRPLTMLIKLYLLFVLARNVPINLEFQHPPPPQSLPPAYRGHLTPSLSPRVGKFDTKSRKVGNLTGQDIAFVTEWLTKNGP